MLDLSKMIKDNRSMKILLKNSIMNKQIKHNIQHMGKNIIDLESDLSDFEQCINIDDNITNVKE